MVLQATGAFVSDLGRHRAVNEDWWGAFEPDPKHAPTLPISVWIVADGLSGSGAGRDAARITVQTLVSAGWDRDDQEAERRLLGAIHAANRDLWERGRTGSQAREHKATIVAAVVRDGDAWIASAGDCRAYLIRSNGIRQLTRDHTLAAEELRLGRIRPEDVARHPGRNTVTRCLGHLPNVSPDLLRLHVEHGDRLLLCSDGLTRHVSDDEILQVVMAAEPHVAANRLVELANQGGGSDNITVGIVALAEVQQDVRSDTLHPSLVGVSSSRLAALQTMGQRINGSLELPATLRSVLDNLVEITGAERACIMLRDEASGQLQFGTGRNLDEVGIVGEPSISRSIVTGVFQTGKPILIGDALADPRFAGSKSIISQALRSVICAPLIVRGQSIGVVYVDNSARAELFTHADLDLVIAFANMAAAAIENARLHEQLAAQIREIGAMKTAQDRILRSVSSGIIAVDSGGTITTCNRAAAEILARPADGMLGRPLGTVLPPRFMLALGLPFGDDANEPRATIQGFEMVGELPGRGHVHFEHRLSPLRDEAGATVGYVVVLDDRTDLERLERERRQATAERERVQRIFGGLMSPDVLQEVLRRGIEGSGIGGDRRTLTVMFADIRGFTGLSERLPPETVVEVLNTYLGAATEVIFEHRGSIDKFIGDEIMALFGVPAPLEDHALQAVRAGLALQKRFAEMPPPQGERASFGIGINTGQGIVGTIGAPNLRSYTVIGDVVNVAARLQGEARAGEILITEDTYRLVAGRVEADELGSTYVKGRIAPVTMYKVTAVR